MLAATSSPRPTPTATPSVQRVTPGLWTYDAAGRLASIPGHINGFLYNARGQVVTAAYANGVTTNNIYNDQRGWLNRVATTRGATVLQDLVYARSPTGRINSVSASASIDSWTYT